MRKRIEYEKGDGRVSLVSLAIRDAGVVASGEARPGVFFVSFNTERVREEEIRTIIGEQGWIVRSVVDLD